MALAHVIGDLRGEAATLYNMACCKCEIGDIRGAILSARRSIELYRELGDPRATDVESWLPQNNARIE